MRPVEVRLVKVCPTEISPSEIGISQVGPAEIGITEVCPSEVGPTEISISQICLVEGDSSEIGSTEVSPAEVSFAEVDPVGATKYCIFLIQISTPGMALVEVEAEIGLFEVSPAEVREYLRVISSPLVPVFSAVFKSFKLFWICHLALAPDSDRSRWYCTLVVVEKPRIWSAYSCDVTIVPLAKEFSALAENHTERYLNLQEGDGGSQVWSGFSG
jgi:hypothetical protein